VEEHLEVAEEEFQIQVVEVEEVELEVLDY
jgi:hypothetical protein